MSVAVRTRRRWRAVAAGALIASAAASVVVWHYLRGPMPAGDELEAIEPYGWYSSKDVGAVFTDGLNIVRVTSQAEGPLRLISAAPLDGSGPVAVLGVLARVLPDMLPADFEVGGFQESVGFPPKMRDAQGGVAVEGLEVPGPGPDDPVAIEIQIGYEVTGAGRYTRRGVELIYEYQGEVRRKVIPSYLAICAPATVECEPEFP